MLPQANVKLLTPSAAKMKIEKDFESKSKERKTSWGVNYSWLNFRRHSQDVVNWLFVIPSVTMRLPLASPEDRTTEPNETRLTVCILRNLTRRQVIVLTASLQGPDQPLRVLPWISFQAGARRRVSTSDQALSFLKRKRRAVQKSVTMICNMRNRSLEYCCRLFAKTRA